jgi:hypothetical protein
MISLESNNPITGTMPAGVIARAKPVRIWGGFNEQLFTGRPFKLQRVAQKFNNIMAVPGVER